MISCRFVDLEICYLIHSAIRVFIFIDSDWPGRINNKVTPHTPCVRFYGTCTERYITYPNQAIFSLPYSNYCAQAQLFLFIFFFLCRGYFLPA
mmetsp:Transcript_8265/g.16881  ORF Transcript_8265/g.16881 Transcript_8265/m.16881 type:complete len:93 (+) Transcript_8265:10-288(+)